MRAGVASEVNRATMEKVSPRKELRADVLSIQKLTFSLAASCDESFQSRPPPLLLPLPRTLRRVRQ